MVLELIFHWTKLRSILVGLLLLTSVSHLSNGIRKRSARQHHQDHKDHSHTDSRLVHGNLLLPLQPRGESPPPSMSSNPLAVEGVFFSKARSFATNRPSLLPGLPHCAPQAWLELEPRPQLLQPQQSRIQVTHAAYTTSRGHCPSSRRVRLTNHVERQPKFNHSTADLQSVSGTLRDRDALTLRS